MGKIRPLSIILSVVMLMPMLSACSSSQKGIKTVKEDDPWYETTRFEITRAIGKNAEYSAQMCTGDDRLFSVYAYSNDRWGSARSAIDTYDLEGNLLSHQDVTCEDDLYIASFYSVSADPDGKTINAIVYVNSHTQNGRQAFATIDAETGKVTDLKDVYRGEAKKAKKSSSGTYQITSIGDYEIALLTGDFVGGKFEWQMFIFKDTEFVAECDLSSLNVAYFQEGFSIDTSTDSLYTTVYDTGDIVFLEFDLNNGALKSRRSFQDLDASKVNIAEYTATDKGDLCKIDTLGNIVKLDVSTMTPKTMVDTNWYTPYFFPVVNTDFYSTSTILSCTDNRTVIWDTESTSYGLSDSVVKEYVRVITKADKNPHAGKKVIDLALPPNSGFSSYMAKAIYEFNKTDNEYLIRVWDKYKTGFVVGRSIGNVNENDQEIYKMIQDLKGDDAPDIAVGIQKNYAMRDDVFMVLTGFLDQEVWDKQYTNIIEAGRINGKLYFLPVILEIEGLVTNEELLKDGAAGITFEEYDELVNDKMRGFSPYDYPASTVYNKHDFLLSCIDTKSAIEGDTINFGTDQFRAAVEYAKENFEYDDLDNTPDEYLDDWNRYRGESYYAKIDDYLDYVHACFKPKGTYKIIGTPSVDASGPRFKAVETVSVSATTNVKDGCRKFLNYLFSGAQLKSDEYDFRQIVTNKDVMNKNIEVLTSFNNELYEQYMTNVQSGVLIPAPGVDKVYGDKRASDEMRESFMESLSTISTYYYEDQTIVQFVFEELAPYYAGDRSLDDAIKYLNDRAYKYVREM